MANVGTAAAGKTLIGAGNGSSPTYASIGTNSGLTLHGVVVAENNGAFQATGAGVSGQLLQSGGPAANPDYTQATYPSTGGASGNVITSDGTDFTSSPLPNFFETITGDTGGALSPTAGNFNIVSTSTNGIQTTGSGSTLTIAMATPYADGDFEFRSAASGATRTVSITNTSDTASSQAKLLTSVAGTSAGDAWHQFTVGSATSYAIGIDNSDSDQLKITYAASGTATPSDSSPFITYNASGGQITQLKAQTNTTAYILNNTTDGAGAQSSFSLKNTVSGGINSANFVVANTADTTARLQGRAEVQTDEQSLGLNLAGVNNAATGTLRMYVGDRAAASLSANCTAAGEWTYALQPAFRATLSADALNVTGAATAYTVAYNVESYDQNADYDNTTYTFTAPVTGIYHFDVALFLNGIVAATQIDVKLTNSAGTLLQELQRSAGLAIASSGTYASSWPATIKLTAADTVKVVLTVSGEAGDVVDVQGGTNTSAFAGWLLA